MRLLLDCPEKVHLPGYFAGVHPSVHVHPRGGNGSLAVHVSTPTTIKKSLFMKEIYNPTRPSPRLHIGNPTYI